jgi:hypothetical protein
MSPLREREVGLVTYCYNYRDQGEELLASCHQGQVKTGRRWQNEVFVTYLTLHYQGQIPELELWIGVGLDKIASTLPPSVITYRLGNSLSPILITVS